MIKSSSRVPSLDGLRAVSILLVVVFHYRLTDHLAGGFLGVDVFFVLSGFLITTLLVQEYQASGAISLRSFYIRRLLRLMPTVLAMLLAVNLFLFFKSADEWRASLRGLFATLTYVNNWVQALALSDVRQPFDITWSLSIEEQFYLLWPPVLCLLLPRARLRSIALGLFLLVAAVAVYRLQMWRTGAAWFRLYHGSDTRADGLLTGAGLGLLLASGFVAPVRLSRRFKSAAIAAFAILAFLCVFAHLDSPLLYSGGFTLVALCVAVLLAALLLDPNPRLLVLLQFSPMVWLGRVSYGLYLWHWPVLNIIKPQSLITSLACIALSLGLTALSFYWIEKPVLSLKDRFTSHKGAPLCLNNPVHAVQ